jgi:DNA mismatch repair protein MutS2
MGVSGQSHAFDIAKRLGMQKEILNKAYEFYERDQSEADKLLSNLQEKAVVINETQLKQQEEYLHIETIKKTQEIAYQTFLSEKDALVEASIKEAKALYEKKIETIDTLIQTLKTSDLATIAMVKGSLKELKKEPQVIQTKETFVVGDHVFVASYQQEGVITSISKNNYHVDLGKFTLPFKSHEITRYEQLKKEKNTKLKQKITDQKPNGNCHQNGSCNFNDQLVKGALFFHSDDSLLFSNQSSLSIWILTGSFDLSRALTVL